MRADTLPPGLARSFPRPAAPATDAGDSDWAFDSLGTRWVLTTDLPPSKAVRAAVTAELDRIDRYWSRFRDDSTVADMVRRPGRYRIAHDDQPLVDWYRTLYEVTHGAVTPLVGQTIADAGYDAEYTLRPKEQITATPAWDTVISGHHGALTLTAPSLIDVGAAGKGFAVDRIAAILAPDHDEFIVDGSGDLYVSPRTTPVRIALEHPSNPSQAIGVLELTSGAVCASAANRRRWGNWHHIVDPRTASPAHDVLATWATAPTTMLADGLATALFFVSPAALRDALAEAGVDIDFGAVVVHRTGVVEHSGMAGLELFT